MRINGKEVGVTCDFGWYGGEQFKLLSFSLLEFDHDVFYPLTFQIAKLCFTLQLSYSEEF
jgi:hypothetical protein